MNSELTQLAATLSNWIEPHPNFTIYLFGSRVRGDHRIDSDVDILAIWNDDPTDVDTEWWTRQENEGFKTISSRLLGQVHIQHKNDPFAPAVLKAAESAVYQIGSVICVLMPPHSDHGPSCLPRD